MNIPAKIKLNITMLDHKRTPSRKGDIENVVEELSNRMVRLEYSVTCYNRKEPHINSEQFNTGIR